MADVMHILSYLKSALGRSLLFEKNDHLDLKGYIDADYVGNNIDRHSTSGYFIFVGSNLVIWRSKNKNVVSLSSAESKPNAATKLHYNSEPAFEIANNLMKHDQTKHVEIYQHFIKEKLEHKSISIPFVPSSEQLADILTHVVSKRGFKDSLDKLGIIDIYAPT
ncbi:hypothetical protein L3X38_011740 [Prunus dulcis]|uniref:Uncharacterized protein n=1 Tax=Prunus dulcis TaxID=3755 RepID=A0AAD4ZFP4_PRUDU|nr:hypothetical protein L3X38_011727 [Prunus dulcis]KAI5343864.1 hypothetical protein L3X38_011740 [Prunus dulcis]